MVETNGSAQVPLQGSRTKAATIVECFGETDRAIPTSGCSKTGAIELPGFPMVKLRIRSMAKVQNIVGPQIRKLRYQQNLTQEQLAARCGIRGWDISRATLSKIEAQIRPANIPTT